MFFSNRFFGFGQSETLKAYLHSRKLRVVVNALHAKSGGGVTYLRNILPLLADDDRLELHVFLHRSQLALFDPIDERIVVHAFEFPPGLKRLMFWEQLVLPIMVHIMSADVVFSPANFGAILIRPQVILLRNALAVAKTETRWTKRAYWVALGLITFLSLLRAKRAIAVSQYAANSLSLGFQGLFKNKIRVIYHGISPLFGPDPETPRENFILAVSDIYVQKNLHTLFQAMKPVLDRHPEMTLRIAGQIIDKWYYQRVIDLAKQLGIEGKIEFLGRLNSDTLLTLYRQCAVFVFPSTAETFGNPLVEAMACGAPVASSNSAAMPEIVAAAAQLFDPLDADDIARSILTLLDNPQLRQSLGQLGLERARQFSWPQTAASTAQVLVEMSQS